MWRRLGERHDASTVFAGGGLGHVGLPGADGGIAHRRDTG